MQIHDIRGFCNFDDLYTAQVDRAVGGEVFVELGSLWGRSTARMAQLIRDSKKDIKFYAVDFWDLRGITGGVWSEEDLQWARSMGVEESPDMCYQTMLLTLSRLGLTNYVTPIKLSTREAYKLFADASLDFVFIDADHSYEGVLEDIQLWHPKVKTGGVLAGHDYDWTGVKQAVIDFFVAKPVYIQNTSWLVKK
tara:strand:+ start:1125 stop:1706 length:582 start_codon:yes stop_codon:yes gene_type:complete